MSRIRPTRRHYLGILAILAGLAILWSFLRDRPQHTVSLEDDEFCWCLSPDGTALVTVTVRDNCVTGPLRLRDLSTGRARSVAFQMSDKLGPVWFCVDGKLLIIKDGDDPSPSGRVILVDAASGTEYANVRGWHGVGSPDGRYLAFADFPESANPRRQFPDVQSKAGVRYSGDWARESLVKLWDVGQAREVTTLGAGTPRGFSPDSLTLLTSKPLLDGDEEELRLWDVATGELKGYFKIPVGSGEARFSPDGRSFVTSWYGAVGNAPNGMKLVDVATGQELVEVLGANSPVFINGGKTLAACQGALINCWETRTGRSTGTLAATGPASSRAYHLESSPDGRWLTVVNSLDSSSLWPPLIARWPQLDKWLRPRSARSKLKVLNTATGSEVAAFRPARPLGFTHDGKRLALGHTGTIEFWDVPPGSSLFELLLWSSLLVFTVLAVRCHRKSRAAEPAMETYQRVSPCLRVTKSGEELG